MTGILAELCDIDGRAYTLLMALSHLKSAQPVDIKPLGERLIDEKSIALIKSEDLELMRIVLPAGKSMPSHRVPGEITILCIEGRLDVRSDGNSHVLEGGQLVFLAGNAEHSLLALEDCSALVTIVLKKST